MLGPDVLADIAFMNSLNNYMIYPYPVSFYYSTLYVQCNAITSH